jgi:hypothetical protein
MDIKRPNFQEEHRKLKEKLALFDDVIEREKKLEDEEKHLAETKVSIQILFANIELLDTDIKRLKAELKRSGDEREAKKSTWNENNGDEHEIVFKAGPAHQSLEQLREAVEFAKLNGVLLEQKLRIEELSATISSKEAGFEKLSKEVTMKLESIRTLENNVRVKQVASNAAKYNWDTKMRTSFAISKFLGQKALSNATTVTKLQSEIDAKTKTIKSLEEKLAIQGKNLQPIVAAGRQIRSRKIELEKANSRQDIISQGNASSYLSMAFADASQYQNFTPRARTDIQSYKSLYGIGPGFVWNFRDCQEFINFVNWCADLRYFQASPAGHGTFPSTRAQRWASRILDDMSHNPVLLHPRASRSTSKTSTWLKTSMRS